MLVCALGSKSQQDGVSSVDGLSPGLNAVLQRLREIHSKGDRSELEESELAAPGFIVCYPSLHR